MKIIICVALLIAIACACAFVGCAPKKMFSEEEWLAEVNAADSTLLYADNRKPNGTFFNPWMPRDERPSFGSPFRYMFSRKKKYDEFDEERYSAVHNGYDYLKDSANNSISYYGHATMIIKMDGGTIFTDPFFSNRAVTVAKKVKVDFDISKVPERSVVLISHSHYDHLDKPSVRQLIKKDATFIVPLGLKRSFDRMGAKVVHELNWWESINVDGIKYTFLPAQHWSFRVGMGWGKTLWGGFMIEGSKTIYFSGDTGYFTGFREFGRRFDIDYAIIEAGAYDPRWFMHYIHTDVPEFFRAADDLGAKVAIPMHFGVISLSDEPILYPLYETDKHISEHGEYAERVRVLRVGEFLEME